MQTAPCRSGDKAILVVEDDETIRELMVRVLLDDGYSVVSAANADGALEACANARFQAIVTDFQLPGMNGVELANVVTRHDASVRVLVAAGCPGTAQDEHRRLAGTGTILGKPFSASDLRSRVHAMLDVRVPEPPEHDEAQTGPAHAGAVAPGALAAVLRRLRGEDGHTLMELLVYMAILGTVLSALASVFVSGSNAQVAQESRFDAQSRARIALDRLRQDIHYACRRDANAAVAPIGTSMTLWFTDQASRGPYDPVGTCVHTAANAAYDRKVTWCTSGSGTPGR